jgi:hypothetical protein
MKPLRLLVFDRTCTGKRLLPGLSHAWSAGRILYRGLGRIDDARGVASWAEALDWLAAIEPRAPIAEVQYWGHGRWGRAFVDRDVLDERALGRGHPLHARLARLAMRMLPGREGLFWFRTCETFGQPVGKRFARQFADFMGCRVAGHTYVIGAFQSGLHSLLPGEDPSWPDDEGVPKKHRGPAEKATGRTSLPGAPNTITCLEGRIPEGM